jgi:hypothetical protein
VPRISVFLGIEIQIHHRDHAPPHFHAAYGEFEASIAIGETAILTGHLPRRVQRRVFEWAAMHQPELEANWHRAQRLLPLERIEPLS